MKLVTPQYRCFIFSQIHVHVTALAVVQFTHWFFSMSRHFWKSMCYFFQGSCLFKRTHWFHSVEKKTTNCCEFFFSLTFLALKNHFLGCFVVNWILFVSGSLSNQQWGFSFQPRTSWRITRSWKHLMTIRMPWSTQGNCLQIWPMSLTTKSFRTGNLILFRLSCQCVLTFKALKVDKLFCEGHLVLIYAEGVK